MFSRLPESAEHYVRRQESLRRIDWVTPTATLASGIVLGLSTFHGTQTVLLMLLLGCLITLYRRKRVEAKAYRRIVQRGPRIPHKAPTERGSSIAPTLGDEEWSEIRQKMRSVRLRSALVIVLIGFLPAIIAYAASIAVVWWVARLIAQAVR